MEPRVKKGDKVELLKRCCWRVKCFVGNVNLDRRVYPLMLLCMHVRLIPIFLKSS